MAPSEPQSESNESEVPLPDEVPETTQEVSGENPTPVPLRRSERVKRPVGRLNL